MPISPIKINYTLATPPSLAQIQQAAQNQRAIVDQISTLSPAAEINITDAKLAGKFAAAGILGAAPFIASKTGEGIVKACAFVTKHLRNNAPRLGVVGGILEIPLRALIGILATIGGALLFGGAKLFSKAQALVWGQQLIEHPQEERINTKLARYGAKEKPWEDFKELLLTFFMPIDVPSVYEGTDSDENPAYEIDLEFDINRQLSRLLSFTAS